MKGYRRYFANKLIWFFITLVVAFILNFTLPRLMPGDPVAAIVARMAQGMSNATGVQAIYEQYTELFGINRPIHEQAAHEKGLDISISDDLRKSNLLITTKNYFRRKPQKIRDAEMQGIPVYAIRGNSLQQIRHCLDTIYTGPKDETVDSAMDEAMSAIRQVKNGKPAVELSPQNAFIRRLQHLLAERHEVSSMSTGKEPSRRVKIVNT